MPQAKNATIRLQATLALLTAMALWGSSFIALKVAFADLPPLWVIFGRMALGSLVFLAAWRWRGQMNYRRGDWKYLAGLAICEPCLYSVFEALALQNTSASQAGMITALLPLMVAMGAFLFLGERITRLSLAGFLLAVVGVIWLSLGGQVNEHAPAPLLGNFYEFLAMVCAMGYILAVKYLSERYSPFLLTAMQSFVGAAFFVISHRSISTSLLNRSPLPASLPPAMLGDTSPLCSVGVSRLALARRLPCQCFPPWCRPVGSPIR